jgi:putative hydrolases of HD superfamily
MTKKLDEIERAAMLLYEIGTLRKVVRGHRQTLLTDDLSDNIASHSFRVTWIGMILAKMEKVNVDRVVRMCLLHDLPESRSGDQNWVHKKYVKVFEEEIIESQFDNPLFDDLKELACEYSERKTPESIVAKDADLLDQVMLLCEHAWSGNKEAELWLASDNQSKMLKTKSAQKLSEMIKKTRPSKWWSSLWTSDRR